MGSRVLNNLILFFVVKAITATGWFFITFVAVRLLPVAVFAQFVLFNVTVIMLTVLSSSFVGNTIIRNYLIYKGLDRVRPFLYNMFYYHVLSMLSAFSLLFIGRFFFNDFLIKVMPFSILQLIPPILFTGLISFIVSVNRAEGHIKLYSLFMFFQVVITFLSGIFLYYVFDCQQQFFYIGYTIALFSFLILVIIRYKKYYMIDKNRYVLSSEYVSLLFSYGLPLAGVGLFSLMLSNIDKYMINFYLGLKSSGLYVATYSISEQSILIITSVIGSVTTPHFFKLFNIGGIVVATDFQSKILKLYLIASLPILMFLNMNYEEILLLYLGENYSSSFCIFPLISFAAFFLGLSNIFSELFTLVKETKTLFKIYMVALIINIVMNILLIKFYGFFGAGMATFISHFFILVLMILGSIRIQKLNIDHFYVLKLLLSILIMMTSNYVVNLCFNSSSLLSLTITMVSTFAIFFTTLLFLRLINLEDLKILSLYRVFSKI